MERTTKGEDEVRLFAGLIKRCVFGGSLKYQPEAFKSDFYTVRKFIRANGMNLRWASDDLKDNDLLVSIAVSNSPMALKYASKRLQDDCYVVAIAVRHNGRALRYASKRLRESALMCRWAFEQSIDAYEYMSDELKEVYVDEYSKRYFSEYGDIMGLEISINKDSRTQCKEVNDINIAVYFLEELRSFLLYEYGGDGQGVNVVRHGSVSDDAVVTTSIALSGVDGVGDEWALFLMCKKKIYKGTEENYVLLGSLDGVDDITLPTNTCYEYIENLVDKLDRIYFNDIELDNVVRDHERIEDLDVHNINKTVIRLLDKKRKLLKQS